MTVYDVSGWHSGDHISVEYKTNFLARMLAAYDDETWNKLKAARKRTYQRAAANLLHDRTITDQLEKWDNIESQRQADIEQRRRDSEPAMRAAIAKAKAEIALERESK